MKHLYSVLLICLSLQGFSQIEPFYGIYDIDSCNFDSLCHLTLINNSPDNIWVVGTPQKTIFNSALSLPYAMITDSVNPYPANNHSYFDVVLNNWGYYGLGIIVGFRHKINTDTLTDGGYIETSYDKGQTWNNVVYEDSLQFMPYFGVENLYKKSDTLKGGIPGFSGTSTEWTNTRIQWVWDFPVKWIVPDTFMLRFHFISDDINTGKEGWMIDNLMISYADLGSSVKDADLQSLSVYPNPMTDNALVSFSNPDNSTLKLQISNLSGKILRSEQVTGTQYVIHRRALKSGIYILTLLKERQIIGNAKLLIN